MEAGIINEESLTSLLRNISQRRRQGVLEISYPQGPVRISFIQGKIVEIERGDVPPACELMSILEESGRIPHGLSWQMPDDRSTAYQTLFDALVGSGVAEGIFLQALRHRILDGIYGLDLTTGSYYTFKVQMVECERNFAPHISVGQVLLDLVALATDSPRFEALFASNTVLKAVNDFSGVLSDEEQILFEMITDGAEFDRLKSASMLSRYHFQDAMLSLHERGAIRIVDKSAAPQKASAGLSGEGLLSSIEGALDDVFSEHALPTQPGRAQTAASVVDVEPQIDIGLGYANIGEPILEQSEEFVPHRRIFSLGRLNRDALHSSSTVGIAAILFFFAVTVLPMLLWGDLFTAFF